MTGSPPPPSRKTRRERQAETRLQVIRAARQLFLDRGFHGTTLASVVEAAGFTKGAVYSNFASKAELALAVVEEIEQQSVEALAAAFSGAAAPAERARVLASWGEALLADTAAIRLRAELSFAAMDDAALGATVRHRSHNVRASVAMMLRGLEHPDAFLLDVDLLAATLSALAVGVGIQRLSDPDYPLDAFALAAGALTGGPVHRTDRPDDQGAAAPAGG